MLGRLIPIAAVKSESAVPSYPFVQNIRSAASSAVSGSKARGRPNCAPLRVTAKRRETRGLPRLFFFVSFLIFRHLITCFVSSGKKLVDTTARASYFSYPTVHKEKEQESNHMGKLKDQVAVVTGASKGIGAGIAKALAAEGASVIVNYSSSKSGADKVVADITSKG